MQEAAGSLVPVRDRETPRSGVRVSLCSDWGIAECRLLDATASTAVRILKQHPLGRLGAFVYIIFIHLFLWIVIQRLQHKALSSDPMLSTNVTNMHLKQ